MIDNLDIETERMCSCFILTSPKAHGIQQGWATNSTQYGATRGNVDLVFLNAYYVASMFLKIPCEVGIFILLYG